MSGKYINIFPIYTRPSKIFPNWDYWFENKPSGSPGRREFLFFGAAVVVVVVVVGVIESVAV
jgi:hypothetical protein